MDGAELEFYWPGFFFAFPVMVVGIVLPMWLFFLVFRYTKLSTIKKVLLIPACIIGPFLSMLFWPLILQLSGIIKMTPDGASPPYLWVANELLGDWSEYVWVGISTVVVFIIHNIIKKDREVNE